MPTQTEPEKLASAERAFVIAPAGFGKTELIARAIELSNQKSLVLTHTHSGVNAMKTRLHHLGVAKEKFEVATIAGWSLRYGSSFPHLSGLHIREPSGAQWSNVYDAAIEILDRKAIREMIKRSFSGVYVDEYQDCNMRQHDIVTRLADLLPCRLLGDPLQAIFDFAEPTINWATNVVPNFERLPDLTTPYRWLNSNRSLGDWLLETRGRLVQGEAIDLEGTPVTWREATYQNQSRACYEAARDRTRTVVAIRKWRDDCHEFASKMGGIYGSMEELDCRDLMSFAEDIDAASNGFKMASLLVHFASRCFTVIGTELRAFAEEYEAERLPSTARLTKNRQFVEALNLLAQSANIHDLVNAIRALDRYPDAKLYRRELWQEMKTTVLTFANGAHASLADTAWYVRDRSRRYGRKSEPRIVSRTLLVKGLEFDHSILLNATELNTKEFYVAMTRGSQSLTVLSNEPVLEFQRLDNVI